MKIAVASDTRGDLLPLNKQYDLFIHCGNFSPPINGDLISIHSQIEWLHDVFTPWLKSINATHKIILPGHGDIAVNYLEPNFEYHVDAMYLREQAVTINGIAIYGSSWIPQSMRKSVPSNSAFIKRNQRSYESSLRRIPDNIDILVTRMPPAGIHDSLNGESIGSAELLEKVKSINGLKMHFFGLATSDGGQFSTLHNRLFVNACLASIGYLELDLDFN